MKGRQSPEFWHGVLIRKHQVDQLEKAISAVSRKVSFLGSDLDLVDEFRAKIITAMEEEKVFPYSNKSFLHEACRAFCMKRHGEAPRKAQEYVLTYYRHSSDGYDVHCNGLGEVPMGIVLDNCPRWAVDLIPDYWPK